MAKKRPVTIAEYIKTAPKEGQPHLRRIHAILKKAAPKAKQEIKWGQPFFIEPRFLFAFSAFKAHCNLAPGAGAMKAFKKELSKYQTTKYFLQMPYDEPLPAELILKIARYCVKELKKRTSDSFW